MAAEKAAKPKRYRIVKGSGLSLPGFEFAVTETWLNGPQGAKLALAIARYEKDNGVQIFGKLIVLE